MTHMAAAIRYKKISMNDMSAEYPAVRIVVTGSRDWSAPGRIYDALDYELAEHQQFLLGVGDCTTGADWLTWHWGKQNLMWPVTMFYAPWRRRGKAAGPIRNHFMIDQFRPRLVLAFLRPESRGTVDCADYAESKGIVVRRFHEGGEGGQIEVQEDRTGPDVEGVRGPNAQVPGPPGPDRH